MNNKDEWTLVDIMIVIGILMLFFIFELPDILKYLGKS